MFKNSEGYRDPTAGQAVNNMLKEYIEDQRRRFRIKNRPLVYVASPYAGDVTGNVAKAVGYCQYAISKGVIPIASHLLYPQMLDDTRTEDRELGMLFGLRLLSLCDEVWVFGLSPGVDAEISEAKKLRITLKYIDMEEMS